MRCRCLSGLPTHTSPYGIGDKAAPALKVLAGMGDEDVQVGLLVKDLLETTVVAAPFPSILILGSGVIVSICSRSGLVGR